MNSQMDQFFRIMLAIAITFIIGSFIVNKLETDYSAFSEDEISFETDMYDPVPSPTNTPKPPSPTGT